MNMIMIQMSLDIVRALRSEGPAMLLEIVAPEGWQEWLAGLMHRLSPSARMAELAG
jgi:hypothetical protein